MNAYVFFRNLKFFSDAVIPCINCMNYAEGCAVRRWHTISTEAAQSVRGSTSSVRMWVCGEEEVVQYGYVT